MQSLAHSSVAQFSQLDPQTNSLKRRPDLVDKVDEKSVIDAKRRHVDLPKETETFPASGLKSTLHGVVYQLKLLMLFAKRGKEQGYAFRLATEMDTAEKFDDVVFQYVKPGSDVQYSRFLQAKHIEVGSETKEKITAQSLLTEKDDRFSLQKYFLSYRKIKQNPMFQPGGLQDFIICTNIDFGFDEGFNQAGLKRLFHTKPLYFEPVAEEDDMLTVGGERYRLVGSAHSKERKAVVSELKSLFEKTSEFKKLAHALAQHLVDDTEKAIGLDQALFKNYQAALVKEVIDVRENKLAKKFLKGDLSLSPEAQRFREALREAVEQVLSAKPVEKCSGRDRKILEILQTEPPAKNPKLAVDGLDAFWSELDQPALKLSNGFKKVLTLDANPQLTAPQALAQEMARLIINKKKSPDKKITVRKGGNSLIPQIYQLAGHVLIERDGTVTFSQGFLKDESLLVGKLQVFRAELTKALNSKAMTLDELSAYTFQITGFQTCQETELAELLAAKPTFPEERITDEEVEDFLNQLVFAVNQPNEERLGELINQEIGEEFNLIDADFITHDFQKRMLDWLKEKQGRYLSENGIDNFFREAREKIAQLVLIGPTSEYTKKVQDAGISFKGFPAQLQVFLNPPVSSAQKKIFNLITPETATLLGSIKVNQALQESTGYNREGSYIFIRLSTLLRLQKQVIQAFRKPGTHLLIVECKPQEKPMNNLYCALSRLLNDSGNKRLLLIAPANDPLAEKFNHHFPEQEQEVVVDETHFSDLNPTSQCALLKTSVNFQGQKEPLCQLLGINDPNQLSPQEINEFSTVINSSLLTQLIIEKEQTINSDPLRLSDLEAAYAKFYETIKLQTLIENLVNAQASDVLFMISSFNLETPLDIENEAEIKNQIKIAINNKKIMLFKGDNETQHLKNFKQLCYDNPKKIIHWISVTQSRFIWQQLYDPNFYVDRKLKKIAVKEVVKSHLLKELPNDLLVFSGLSEKSLYELLNITKIEEQIVQCPLYVFEKHQDAEVKFNQLIEENKTPVHWLKLKKTGSYQQLVWHNPNQKNLLPDKSEFRLVSDDKLVVIVDEPGMGKSTTLTQLTEERMNTSWVIRLNLKDCQKVIGELSMQQFDLKQAVDFLWAATGGSLGDILATNLLSHQLQSFTTKFARPLLILLDGFDEISDEHQEKVIDFIQFLNDQSSAQVWVTTRQHPKLEQRLKALFTTEFEAFDRSKQIEFLREFWQIRHQLLLNQKESQKIFSREPSSKFLLYADALLAKSDIVLGEKVARFIGIPLQMRLLSEAFQKDFTKFIGSSDVEVPDFKTLNVFDIYQRFIETKYIFYFKEKTQLSKGLNKVSEDWMKKVLIKLHQRLGFQVLFPKENKLFLGVKSPFWEDATHQLTVDDNQMKELYRVGLIQPIHGKGQFEFIHRTFAEYFTVDLLSNWLTRTSTSDRPKNPEVQEFLLKNLLIGSKYQVVRAFLNGQLTKNSPTDSTLTEYGKRIAKLWLANVLRNEQGETFLIIACREGNTAIISFLINSLKEQKDTLKSLVGYRTRHEDTVLHWSAKLGETEVVQALLDAIKDDPKALKTLLETKDKNGQTAVYWATVWEKTRVVQALLDAVKNDPEALKNMEDNIEAAKKDDWTQLCWAAQNGHSEAVKLLIEKGAEINAININHETPLHLAAQNGHSETVKLLIDKGAEINAINKNHETPLYPAAQNGHSEAVKLLIDKGAEINAINKKHETPLHLAAQNGHSEAVKLLIDKGAEINAISKNHETPLHLAAQNGHSEAVKLLIDKGAENNVFNKNHQTPLHLITEKYLNPEVKILVVKILLDVVKNDPKALKDMVMTKDKSGNIALHNAVSWAESEIVQALLDVVKDDPKALKDMVMAIDNNGKTVLHWAADGVDEDNSSSKIIQILLNLNIVKNDPKTLKDIMLAKDKDGYTVLNWMAKNDRVKAVQALLDVVKNDPKTLKDMVLAKNEDGSNVLSWMTKLGKVEVVQALLNVVKNDPEALKNMMLAKDEYGYIALCWVFMHGNLKVAQVLLDVVENDSEILKDMVMARDNNGKTVLHWAVDGDPEILQTLFDAVKNIPEILKDMVMARDNDGKIVLHHAMKKRGETDEMIQALLDAVKKAPEILKYMVMARDNNGGTPLHCAMQRSSIKLVQMLLDVVENDSKTLKDMVMAKDNNGKTALHCAIAGWEGNYNKNVIQELLDGIKYNRKILEGLLEDKDGEMKTALHLAAQQGFVNTVKVLITNGAKTEAVGGRDNLTPLHLAARQGHLETAQFLLKKGADIFAKNTHNTVLHQAVLSDNPTLMQFILKAIEDKLENNPQKIAAAINTPDGEGDTPLMWAIEKGKSAAAQVLLKYGVDISIKK